MCLLTHYTQTMEKKTIWDLNRVDVEHFRRQSKMRLTVVLDNVRSLNNIGAIFRTCDAFAVERIMLCGISACPPRPKSTRPLSARRNRSSGLIFRPRPNVSNRCCAKATPYVVSNRSKGVWSLQDFNPQDGHRYALVLGHEVNGVDQNVVNQCDVCLEIPQARHQTLAQRIGVGWYSHMALLYSHRSEVMSRWRSGYRWLSS